MVHELKCHPLYFEAIVDGRKPFEIRKNDRRFHFGDELHLREYDPSGLDKVLMRQPYSGRECRATITYVLSDAEYVKEGFVVMGIKVKSND